MGLQKPVFKACFLPQIKDQKGGSAGVPHRKNCGTVDNQPSGQTLRHALPEVQPRG
jgi:hypothetical protein